MLDGWPSDLIERGTVKYMKRQNTLRFIDHNIAIEIFVQSYMENLYGIIKDMPVLSLRISKNCLVKESSSVDWNSMREKKKQVLRVFLKTQTKDCGREKCEVQRTADIH